MPTSAMESDNMPSEQSTTDIDAPTLLRIPLEIRRQILHELLVIDPNHEWTAHNPGQRYPDRAGTSGFDVTLAKKHFDWDEHHSDLFAGRYVLFNLHLAVLRVCKQLYVEGGEVLLEENKFVAMIGGEVFSKEYTLPWEFGGLDFSDFGPRRAYDRWTIRRPAWVWTDTDQCFVTSFGNYRPNIVLDFGWKQKGKIALITMAEFWYYARDIQKGLDGSPFEGPFAVKGQGCRPQMVFNSLPKPTDLGCAAGVNVVDFFDDMFFSHNLLRASTTLLWNFRISTASSDGTRQSVMDTKILAQMTARDICWASKELQDPYRQSTLINDIMWRMFEAMRKALAEGNTKDALNCLQDLLHRHYYIRDRFHGNSAAYYALWLDEIVRVSRYVFCMLSDTKTRGFFDSTLTRLQWTVLTLMSREHLFLSPRWKGLYYLRLAELFIHTGNAKEALCALNKAGAEFAPDHLDKPRSRSAWAQRITRRIVIEPFLDRNTDPRKFGFSVIQKRRGLELIQEWRSKARTQPKELLKFTFDDLKTGNI